MSRDNGDGLADVRPADRVLSRILLLARLREAADANAGTQQRSRLIERARQARIRARDGRA